MTKPGFRKGRPGRTPGGGPTDAATDAFVSGALFSQAQILQLMKNEFARSRRHGIPLGCLLLSVDRLAQLVDLYGSGLRQAVRSAITEMVRERTRAPDLLGTSSEDRYLLLLPHTDVAETRLVAERMRQRFSELELSAEGRELALTLSIGISASLDGDTLFFDTLVAQAEAAVEYASERGGNLVVSFGESRLRGSADPDAADSGTKPAGGGGKPE